MTTIKPSKPNHARLNANVTLTTAFNSTTTTSPGFIDQLLNKIPCECKAPPGSLPSSGSVVPLRRWIAAMAPAPVSPVRSNSTPTAHISPLNFHISRIHLALILLAMLLPHALHWRHSSLYHVYVLCSFWVYMPAHTSLSPSQCQDGPSTPSWLSSSWCF